MCIRDRTTIIGNNVKIYQGVTLGALSTRGGQSLKNTKRHPTIEDNVTIYSGASILGGDTIVGKGAVIGGNAFITKSVPEGAKVSIKNQELRYKYDASHPVEKKDCLLYPSDAADDLPCVDLAGRPIIKKKTYRSYSHN